MQIPLLLSLALSITHLFSKNISKLMEKYHYSVLSFSSGIFISLILLVLLPEVVAGASYVNIYFLILIGFIIFHASEKYIYQHVKNKKTLMKDLAELHYFGFFLDHFVIGFALILLFQTERTITSLVFVPFFLHTISSSMALEHLHEKSKSNIPKLILSSSTFIGALTARLLQLEQLFFYSALSLVLGSLLYVIVRDMMPMGKKGDLKAFITGALIMILIVWMI